MIIVILDSADSNDNSPRLAMIEAKLRFICTCILYLKLFTCCMQVLVWHVKTQRPWILFEAKNPTDDRYEI